MAKTAVNRCRYSDWRVSLHRPEAPVPLRVCAILRRRDGATCIQRSEETGLFGPLTVAAAAQPLCPELRQFCHCFQSALLGAATDWRLWLGKRPGLTPSHDDTGQGMLLAARYFGAIDERAGREFLPNPAKPIGRRRSWRKAGTAAMGYFASPLLHFIRMRDEMLAQKRRLADCWRWGTPLALDTLLGFWLGQQIVKRIGNENVGGYAWRQRIVQRGSANGRESNIINIADAVPALAQACPLSYRLAIVHGSGGSACWLYRTCWKAVEPYPLDVLALKSGMIGYITAQRLALEPDIPPVTTVLTRIKVSADDPHAFLEPERNIGPFIRQRANGAGSDLWMQRMKRDGKHICAVVVCFTTPR